MCFSVRGPSHEICACVLSVVRHTRYVHVFCPWSVTRDMCMCFSVVRHTRYVHVFFRGPSHEICAMCFSVVRHTRYVHVVSPGPSHYDFVGSGCVMFG